MRKIVVAAISVVLSLVLVVAIVLAGNTFLYYPHYRANKQEASIEIAQTNKITMMSYNLRCISPTDFGKKAWFYRADLVVKDIEEQKPGIIGFQEATKWHYSYLVECLPGYDSIITYRDEAFNSEGCPIFYNTALYTLVEKGSFWLSETPEVMSKSWGAQFNRVCSFVILEDNATNEKFVVFNTHLSHVSDEARINGIKVVLEKIKAFGGYPAVIMGDFNALEGSETYKSATENFLDAQKVAEITSDSHTYQNWGNEESFKRIDYFMVSKTGFKINSYSVLPGMRNGVYTSDHNPILLEVELEK
jgi:endonuclease/exonuclease/phosphatase family metal-dependent hydrolase